MTSTDTLAGGVAAADDDVAAFASAVRSHLDDLPADEVEDLVDGLEADLIERREDSDEPLGDPREYADELRAAAGLPPRREHSSGEWFGGYKRLARNTSAWVREQRENPLVGRALDFLLALRPVWWVLRGWAVYRLTIGMNASGDLPDTTAGWGLLAVFVVVSVQWGRGRWMPWPWMRVAKRVVSGLVVLALPFMIGAPVSTLATGTQYSYSVDQVPMEQLSANGVSVTNVFAYDCAGNPISGVQLFDQDGNPLEAGDAGSGDWFITYDEEGNETAVVPNPDTNPGSGWNVFPLFNGRFGSGDVRPDPTTFEQAAFPFDAVQPLADSGDTCSTVENGSNTDGSNTDESSADEPNADGSNTDEPDPAEPASPTDGAN